MLVLVTREQLHCCDMQPRSRGNELKQGKMQMFNRQKAKDRLNVLIYSRIYFSLKPLNICSLAKL